jgi:hypothetical protein
MKRAYEEEARTWARANRLAIKTLKAKLLSIGGQRISPQPNEPGAVVTARYGTLEEFPVTLRKMEANRCHHNVKVLWTTRKPKSRLAGIGHGYALSEDGMWRPHSWAISGTKGNYRIIETTTEIRIKYFGVSLFGEGADIFASL